MYDAPSSSLETFKEALVNNDNELLSSMPDWAPTSNYPKKRQRRANDSSYGFSFTVLRWPVLIVTTLWILLLLVFYSVIRLWVSISEWLWVWRGRRKVLRARLRASSCYSEWVHNARELDSYLGLDSWRTDPRSSHYDFKAVSRATRQLKRITSIDSEADAEKLAIVLESCIKYNFSGIHNQSMYSQTYSGTKHLVEDFNEQLLSKIQLLKNSPLQQETKRVLFESFSKQLGRSALSLSGGASLSYRHFGVVKALIDRDLLPTIISGTSGGGLVAALVGTRTDDELQQLLTPALADHLTACWEPFPRWVQRWWRTGARFDAVDWAERCRFFTLGDMTFKEAYERTGRVLNITMVPADVSAPTVLCNYVSSPNCVIWTALLASAAVPGILNPVVLMEKNARGEFVPYSLGSKWRDGSLRTDVPVQALNTFFNVNFPIVSQVNPHIRLFAYLPKGQVGRPVIHKYSSSRWRGGFILSAAEIGLKLEIKKNIKLIRNLNLLPQFLNQDWSNVFLQRFTGAVTVWPKAKIIDLWRILSDPNREQLAELMRSGENAMYPKIRMISTFVALEREIEAGLERFGKIAIDAPAIPSVIDTVTTPDISPTEMEASDIPLDSEGSLEPEIPNGHHDPFVDTPKPLPNTDPVLESQDI